MVYDPFHNVVAFLGHTTNGAPGTAADEMRLFLYRYAEGGPNPAPAAPSNLRAD